jgi:hypothetical protein
MKTFAVFLCLIATTANAAPLYLRCDGKGYDPRDPSDSDAELVTQSIKIDGTSVTFEGDYLMPILSDDGDVLTFGSETSTKVSYGTLNRITGRVEITFEFVVNGKRLLPSRFEGVCHKTEKLF